MNREIERGGGGGGGEVIRNYSNDNPPFWRIRTISFVGLFGPVWYRMVYMENTMNHIFRISSVIIIIENFRSKNSKKGRGEGWRPRESVTRIQGYFSPP